ncbi:MAG: tryptophan synthase subunit alpha [Chitinophagia bacterium]|jgi:tryptophan synthase alpha chain
MSRIASLFQKKKSNILNVYCTAGYPHLDSTLPVMSALQESGVDMIELGIPYSDPLADGPVIQASSSEAIANGMTLELLFDQLKDLRKPIGMGGIGNQLPVILMGYLNPVIQFGFEKFCAKAAEVGVDGIILPDLPAIEFRRKFGEILHQYQLDFIFLVTPETSQERILLLDSLSSGFLYAVSSSATTGKDQDMQAVSTYLQKLQNMPLKNPVLVGFGINNRSSFLAACNHASGAIIGSAFIKALHSTVDLKNATQQFIHSILHDANK